MPDPMTVCVGITTAVYLLHQYIMWKDECAEKQGLALSKELNRQIAARRSNRANR